MKKKDIKLHTTEVYTMIIQDLLVGETEAFKALADEFLNYQGYKLDRLMKFYGDTYDLVNQRIKRRARVGASKIITLTNEMIIQ